jgi:FlaA1/EpsC-like NDP-sugar epimerase
MTESNAVWTGSRVLITGVCGTVGRELLRQVVAKGPAEVIGIDNNESEIFFARRAYGAHENVRLYVGDVRDQVSLQTHMREVDYVLHTAAFKHVEICESSPRETVNNNVLGIQNVIEAARECDVARVLFTSSDKAVNPTSVMGTSKLMGERLMAAADVNRRGGRTLFAATRFGNVLGSRGSVIPLFTKQILAGGPVTITDPAMTRFIMSLDQAVNLVMDSLFISRGGEVFVTKMPVVSIEDLAHVMIEELAPRGGRDPDDIPIEIIGTKPGEKLYEELLNEEEVRRAIELDAYFVVLPALRSAREQDISAYNGFVNGHVDMPYNSSNQQRMSRAELGAFLNEHDLLPQGHEQDSEEVIEV